MDRAQRRAATDGLIGTLRSPSALVQYSTAIALQNLWSEDATSDVEALRAVNAVLAAALFEGPPSQGAYGPGLALLKINGEVVATLTSLTPEELVDKVESWVTSHPDLLPPLADQPWGLLLAAVKKNADAARRQEAKTILVREKPLAAVDAIARYLRGGERSTQPWADMADLLTGITGLAFPRTPPAEDLGGVVDKWMKEWDEHLKGQKGDTYRRYSWQRFERGVARANEDPTPENWQAADRLRTILLHELDGPEDIPKDASPPAKGLIEKMLTGKASFAEALKNLQEGAASEQQIVFIGKMEQVADSEGGKAIGRQFLDQVVAYTRKQDRAQIRASLARLLTTVTSVPLLFRPDATPKEVSTLIDQWLEKVRQGEQEVAAGAD
jgi:hypothetical protein